MTLSSLMVHMTAGLDNDALLTLSSDLAKRLKAKRIIGISACRPLQLEGEPMIYVPQDFFDKDQAEMERQLREAEHSFSTAIASTGIASEWRSEITYNLLADYIAQQSRAADLIITNSPAEAALFETTRRAATADIVLRAGRPVLVAHSGVEKLDLGHVLVAWKDSREARRAVEDALPLLKIAEKITIVEVTSASALTEAQARIDDVVRWLGRHGINASSRVDVSEGDDAARLDVLAQELGAGLVVGGAYGHNRLREWVLGGVTRDLLLAPARCSLVSH